MKYCRACSMQSSASDKGNAHYAELVELVLASGDERQLLCLMDLMRGKITTGVTTSIGSNKLCYPEEHSWRFKIICRASAILAAKLDERIDK